LGKHEIEAAVQFSSGSPHLDGAKSKMAAMEAVWKGISSDLDRFYETLEMKYWSGLEADDISEKIAVSSCFKELRLSKERSIALYLSGNSPRENLQHKIAALHPLACS
jgi:hypothetical protein